MVDSLQEFARELEMHVQVEEVDPHHNRVVVHTVNSPMTAQMVRDRCKTEFGFDVSVEKAVGSSDTLYVSVEESVFEE